MTEPWLIIRTPSGVHCWPLPEGDLDAALLAARVTVGFPADDAWAGGGWDLQVTYGRPHAKLLRHATVHDATELGGVDTVAHAAALEQARVVVRRADAEARWEALPEDMKADVLARHANPVPLPVKGRTA